MPVAAALLWKHALYNPDYGLLNGTLNWIWQLFGAEEGPVVDWVSQLSRCRRSSSRWSGSGRRS